MFPNKSSNNYSIITLRRETAWKIENFISLSQPHIIQQQQPLPSKYEFNHNTVKIFQ